MTIDAILDWVSENWDAIVSFLEKFFAVIAELAE